MGDFIIHTTPHIPCAVENDQNPQYNKLHYIGLLQYHVFSFYQNSSIHLSQTLMALGSDKTFVRFGVLTVLTIKINFFWDIMSCRQVDHY
jgi:hypothetical protein